MTLGFRVMQEFKAMVTFIKFLAFYTDKKKSLPFLVCLSVFLSLVLLSFATKKPNGIYAYVDKLF